MAERYKSIGMKESDYRAIAEKKQAIESLIGKRLDWAEFLLLLADLRPVGEIIKQGQVEVAELHEGEPAPESDELESFFLPSTEEVEQIVNTAANRVITEVVTKLKGG